MSEELEVLGLVTGRLDEAGIPYMVTGSFAMNYYAVPRMTRDIDLVVELTEADVGRLVRLFEEEFYIDGGAVREAIQQQSMFNLIHQASVIKVDMLVRKQHPYRKTEFARRRPGVVMGHRFSIVAPEDLILSKLAWAKDSRSQMQLGDVRNLIASVRDLDRAYIEEWVSRLGLDELYREVRA